MSLADYASGPFPVLTKLASLLRNTASAVFRLSALFLRAKITEKSPASDFDGAAFAIVQHSPNDKAVAEVENGPRSEREQLIRRRWAETGIRMWNARFHGSGQAPLNIQGSVELLPPGPGETVRRYDKLEFRLLGGQIVCEGVVVDSPEGRNAATSLQLNRME